MLVSDLAQTRFLDGKQVRFPDGKMNAEGPNRKCVCIVTALFFAELGVQGGQSSKSK